MATISTDEADSPGTKIIVETRLYIDLVANNPPTARLPDHRLVEARIKVSQLSNPYNTSQSSGTALTSTLCPQICPKLTIYGCSTLTVRAHSPVSGGVSLRSGSAVACLAWVACAGWFGAAGSSRCRLDAQARGEARMIKQSAIFWQLPISLVSRPEAAGWRPAAR